MGTITQVKCTENIYTRYLERHCIEQFDGRKFHCFDQVQDSVQRNLLDQ